MFILILLPFSGWTQTDRFVTTGGTDSGDCSGAPCLTIGYAVSQASSNDNVNVGAGTFAESVVVDKSLTITGANVGIAGDGSRTAETIIDPASSAVAFTITAADVTIDGFQIGTDTSTSNASTGIDIQFTGSNIANNVIYADLAAIVIDSLSSGIVTIDNNEIQMLDLVATGANASVGVSLGTLTGTVDVDLSNNNITKASYGVFVFNANSSSRLAVDGGTFTRCTRGIQVNNWDGTNYTASNIDIQNVIMTQFIGPGGGLSQPDAHAGIYAFVGNNGNTSTDIDLAITSVDISGIGNTQTDYSAIYLADFNGGGNDVSDGIGITASITLSNVHDNFNRGIYSRGGDAVATVYRSTVSGNGFDPESSNAVGHGMYAYNGGSIVASECVIVNPSLASQAASTTAYGLSVAKQGSAYPASSIVVDSSSISTNGNGFLVQGSSTASGTVNMSGNWLGSFSEATITTNISNTTNVDISPWLGSGTDTEGGTAGFQGSFASLYVGTSGMQNGGDRIQEAHDVLVESGQITLNLADYTETLTVSKDMILAPQSTGSDTVSIDNLVINGSGKTLQIDGNLRVNSALTTTDGIIQMLNDTHLVLGSSATAPTESSTSYVQGNYNVEPRAVGTGSLDVLGVNIASGSDDLGNVSVSRVTGPEAVITDGLSTSIASVWTITADNQPAGGRNISFTWQMEHDNGKDLSSMVMMSNDGGGWVVQSAAQDVTPSPSTDPRVFPAFSVTA
ncbi:MAG: hypothetical protein KI790_20855, partial [Cyclobacteriaceae bacterium]|nr:hypothetical protein [Cyclobacteriaceae bacterium HetDA_MAG_MS6]